MVRREIAIDGMSETALASAVREIIAALPVDAVLSIRLTGTLSESHWRAVSSARLRAMAPRTMNVDVVPSAARVSRRHLAAPSVSEPEHQLSL
jgi:hypothetical protein